MILSHDLNYKMIS